MSLARIDTYYQVIYSTLCRRHGPRQLVEELEGARLDLILIHVRRVTIRSPHED